MSPDTPRSVQMVREAIAAADSLAALEQLRAFTREQYAGREREDLEELIDRRAANFANPAQQLSLDVDEDDTYDGPARIREE